MAWLFLFSCGSDNEPGSSELQAYVSLLETIDEEAREGEGCFELRSEAMRTDCVWAAVRAIGGQDSQRGESWCQRLSGLAAEECFFLLAESAQESAWCSQAGSLERDCRLHALTRLHQREGAGPSVEDMERQLLSLGLDAEDDAPWLASWRHRLAEQRPLDLAPCDRLESDTQAARCVQAGLGLFEDRLRHGRDRGLNLCEDPLPSAYAIAEHPLLMQRLRERRRSDLCREGARRTAPPGALR